MPNPVEAVNVTPAYLSAKSGPTKVRQRSCDEIDTVFAEGEG